MQITPYQDINKILDSLKAEILALFPTELVGIYLTGSLSYGDFNLTSSDIDLLVVLKTTPTKEQVDLIGKLHERIKQEDNTWANRLECSYIPVTMLQEILPPKAPRPYFGAGIFYAEAPYGNEWLINTYLLHKHGIALMGPPFSQLVQSVDIKDVKEANIRDLLVEWEPKLKETFHFPDSHHKAYAVLNLCRILHTHLKGEPSSKRVSADWIKKTFSQWRDLIDTAQAWQYGVELDLEREVKDFIRFAIEQIHGHTSV